MLRAYPRLIVFQISCRYLKSSVVIDWLDGSLLEFEHSLFALHLLWLGELFVDVGADAGA